MLGVDGIEDEDHAEPRLARLAAPVAIVASNHVASYRSLSP